MSQSTFAVHAAVFAFVIIVAMHVGYTLGHKYAARYILRRVRQLCIAQEQVKLSDLIAILKEEAGGK
jgi:hypothetical protein